MAALDGSLPGTVDEAVPNEPTAAHRAVAVATRPGAAPALDGPAKAVGHKDPRTDAPPASTTEPFVSAPPVPPYYNLEGTTFRVDNTVPLAEITKELRVAFSANGVEHLEDLEKCKFRCSAFIDHAHVEFQVRLFDLGEEGEIAVETQRRAGCPFTFAKLYRMWHNTLSFRPSIGSVAYSAPLPAAMLKPVDAKAVCETAGMLSEMMLSPSQEESAQGTRGVASLLEQGGVAAESTISHSEVQKGIMAVLRDSQGGTASRLGGLACISTAAKVGVLAEGEWLGDAAPAVTQACGDANGLVKREGARALAAMLSESPTSVLAAVPEASDVLAKAGMV